MRRTAVLWEAFVTRKGWLTAEEAGELLGMSARHFRRLRARYAEAGAEGLRDRRLGRVSGRRAPESELARMRRLYREEGTVNLIDCGQQQDDVGFPTSWQQEGDLPAVENDAQFRFLQVDPADHVEMALLEFARHYGYLPKACRPYRAKTKGKVERPFRYIREDFFLGRSFRNLDDLNGQFRHWLDQVANARVHATTRRVVAEHFAEERPKLQPLPAGPFQAVLRLERRISRDGMVSVGGNLYSVPNAARRRPVEVHSTTDEVRILEEGSVIAVHPVLDGRGQRRIVAGHRTLPAPANSQTPRNGPASMTRSGEIVALRSLSFYDAVGRRLAAKGAAA